MSQNRIQKFLFHLASRLTDAFPRLGARFLDGILHFLLGNKFLVWGIRRGNLWKTRRIDQPKKILVVADIHIGDAVLMQGAVQAFRNLFPRSRVDYAVKKAVAPILEGHPAVSNLYPCFTGTFLPEPSDVESLRRLAGQGPYDLFFNGCPFFADGQVFPQGPMVLDFVTVAPTLVRNEKDGTGIDHFLFQSYRFVEELFKVGTSTSFIPPFRGAEVMLSDEAFELAEDWIKGRNLGWDKPIVFLNPDTASPYTLIPLEDQRALLKNLVRLDCNLFLGTAFTHQGLEKKLLESLEGAERERVTLVPSALSLEAYSSLLDFVDVFLTGDTGPLHIAAARKVSSSGNVPFRNKTFVIGLFGATPPRMSGYDSKNPLFPPAFQDAPSRTYVAKSPCRNLTCANKMLKTCRKARCFEGLDLQEILGDIQEFLEGLRSFRLSRTRKQLAGIS